MKIFIAITAVFSLLATGCKKNGCFESSGSTTINVRAATPFSEIDVYDNISIILKQDTTEGITIQAGANLQPYIKADIVNNVLSFRNTSGCSWLKGASETITAYVSVKTLAILNLHGSGNISSVNTLTNSQIAVNAWEAASDVQLDIHSQSSSFLIRDEDAVFNISGYTGYASVYGGEKGIMNLKNLQALQMDFDQRSIHDAYIWVTEWLNVRVQYKGNVYYKGAPYPINYQHFNDGRLVLLQ
jgi:hypothetical protein